MITLLVDWLVALVKFTDRGMTAVEKNVRHRLAPRAVVDALPAGAGSAGAGQYAGTGGHPIEPTSVLLNDAAAEIQNLGRMSFSVRQPWIEGFAAELRDRAAQFSAAGD